MSRFRTVKLLIAIGVLATVVHFADNTLAIERYPEPSWITPFGVVASWFVITALAVAALVRRTADGLFFACAGIYSLVLLSGLLHYAYGAPMHMAARSNATVLAEALAGVVLVGALLTIRR